MKRLASRGFSYVEVIITMLVVVIALVPGMQALSRGIDATRAHEQITLDQLHISSRLHELLAQSLSSLENEAVLVASKSTPTAFSDPVSAPRRRLVYLALYDADNADLDGNRFTGGDAGLVWVRVELEGSALALETLTGL